MRYKEFAIAKKALIESTQDKTTIPESFRLIGNNVLHGKKGKQHTVIIGVPVPSVKLDYGRIELRGDGKLLEPPREFELHSYTRNFHNWMASHCGIDANDATNFQDGNLNFKDTGGTVRSSVRGISISGAVSCESTTYGYFALYGITTSGIVVGTGTIPGESYQSFNLVTPIAHGVGSGQLCYATSQSPAPDIFTAANGDGTHSYALARFFDNFNSDQNSITVNEIGQICRLTFNSVAYNALTARDEITPLVIPFRAQAKITYNYSLYYPNSGSPLRNRYNLAMSQGASLDGNDTGNFGNGFLSLKDTGGNIRTENFPLRWFTGASLSVEYATCGYFANAGTITSGMRVGTSSQAVSFDDFALIAPIAHGVAGGELTYSVSEVPVKNWAAPVMTISHARTFSNASGGTITVRETGLIGRYNFTGSAAYPILDFRDVVSDVAIADGESLRVVYQLRVTYPDVRT